MDFSIIDLVYAYWVLTALLGIISLVWYKFHTRNFHYWTAKGIPQIRPIPFLGTSWFFLRHPLTECQDIATSRYGRVYGAYPRCRPILMVADAELVRAVCIKDFDYFLDRIPAGPSDEDVFSKMLTDLRGEDWKRVRTVITPTFSSGKLKRMYPLMVECASDLLKHIQSLLDAGKSEVTVKDVFGRFTIDVIGRVAFAIRTRTECESSQTQESNLFVKHAVSFFTPVAWRIFFFIFLPRWLLKLVNFQFTGSDSINFFIGTSKRIIEERRSMRAKIKTNPTSPLPVDFVNLMLEAAARRSSSSNTDKDQAQDTHHVTETAEEREAYQKVMKQYGSRMYMEDKEMIAQACLFLVAGYETTSTVLSFTAYALAQHPDIQERLYRELSRIDSQDHEAIFKCDYLTAVLNESMRLYTPVSQMDRAVTKDYNLPAPYSHVTLTKGMTVKILFHAIHHDPDYWPEPLKFDPERFMPENADQIVPYSFLPFGVGPRNCIAMRFALMEVKLALTRVVLRYRFGMTEKTPRHPPRYMMMTGILKTREDIILTVQPR